MTARIPASFRHARWVVFPLAALVLSACGQSGQTDPASWPNVSADLQRAYVAFGPAVHAVDLQTGDEVWRYPVEPDRDLSFYAAPAVADDGIIYAGAYDHSVRALDAETGNEVASFDELDGRVIGSPVITGEILLIPTDGGSLYAFDRSSGEELWTFRAPGPLWSAPRVEGDVAYVASLRHTVHAIDLVSGAELWPSAPALNSAIADTPALDHGLLLAGLLGDSLVAVRTLDGAEVWRTPTAGWVWGSPLLADGSAYFGDVEGNLYAVEADGGRIVWQDVIDGSITSTPAVFENHLLIGTQSGVLAAYDPAARTSLWERSAAGPILGDPLVAGDKVLVAVTSAEALLQAYRASDGTPLWTFLPPAPE